MAWLSFKCYNILLHVEPAPRAWYEKMVMFLKDQGLQKSEADYNLYYLNDKKRSVILVVCVVDLLVTLPHKAKVEWIKE